jgi:hypothetical protein
VLYTGIPWRYLPQELGFRRAGTSSVRAGYRPAAVAAGRALAHPWPVSGLRRLRQ